jgi:hypothetical protein
VAWTTPLTATSNTALTAAQWNASVRDNLLETAPAKATTAGSIFVATSVNQIAERPVQSSTIDTAETTTSTSFTNLATVGPQITAVTGDKALLMCSCQMSVNAVPNFAMSSWEITGASAAGPSDNTSISHDSNTVNEDHRSGDSRRLTGLNAGTNVATMKYRVSGGTGTFQRRHMILIGL